MTYEDALGLTDRQAWSRLSEEGKVAVLQAIEDEAAAEAEREARTVEAKWLYVGDDGIELGRYESGPRTVYVNSSQLAEGSRYGDDPDKMVETVLHEGRHAFQHDVAEGKVPYEDQETVKAWADNLAPGGYVTFAENPRAYYDQPVEADARSYASARLSQIQGERVALAERAAEKAAAEQGPDQGAGEKGGPAPGAGEGSVLGAGKDGAGTGVSGGDGHDDARAAFEATASGSGERGDVVQRQARGPRML